MAGQGRKDKFVAALTELGGSAGNGRLREALQWDEAAYNAVKDELVAEGVVTPGRGRGGSVSFGGSIEAEAEDPAPITARAKPARVNGNGGNLGFEADLFKAADKLRGNMEPSDYKHVALGLIFLKHISDTPSRRSGPRCSPRILRRRRKIPDEYLCRERVLGAEGGALVPPPGERPAADHREAYRRRHDQPSKSATNPGLEGVLPKDYATGPALDKVMLGELIDLDLRHRARAGTRRSGLGDVLGRVYEYFLGGFAGSEGKRGGRILHAAFRCPCAGRDAASPFKGRVYDPCCGSGGMFVQSETFALESTMAGGSATSPSMGRSRTTPLGGSAKMNLAVRGIDADIKLEQRRQLPHSDELRDLQGFDFILANPPFNISDWGGERLEARMHAGPTACRPRAMQTTRGSSISCGTIFRLRAARPAWCWRTGPCPRRQNGEGCEIRRAHGRRRERCART